MYFIRLIVKESLLYNILCCLCTWVFYLIMVEWNARNMLQESTEFEYCGGLDINHS
jgi:hypothetical protein